MTTVNRQIRLAARPVGLPKVSDFQLAYSPLESPAPGQVLVRSSFLSLDPYMRGRMDGAASYARPIAVGEVMAGGAAAYVLESDDSRFHAGEAVTGMLGWQEYAAAAGDDLTKIDPGVVPISTALGVLGMPGLTAYFGLLDVCEPRARETVVVSGAAGAVGMLVGQIAKIQGCRVVAVTGSDLKCAWLLDELGLDAAINHNVQRQSRRRPRAPLPRRHRRLLRQRRRHDHGRGRAADQPTGPGSPCVDRAHSTTSSNPSWVRAG